jgi:menaquinone-9 beta-reductase
VTTYESDVLADPGRPGEPSASLLEVSDLEVSFPSEDGRVRAVRGLSYRVAPGEVLGIVGVAGGYSVLNVRLHEGAATMGILTGSIPSLGFPSGKAILDEFAAREGAWIGPRVFGGSGAIALRRPHDRLASERIAVIGDAGCQVFPAHGSGVGAGLVAARLLADTLAAGRPLRDYEVAWQRRHGGVFAFFDVFRRWNQDVDSATLGRVMGLGLVDAATLRAGLDQVVPPITPAAIVAKVRPLVGEPALARELAVTAARSAVVRALYAWYPRNAAHVPRWSRYVDRVMGTRHDPMPTPNRNRPSPTHQVSR